MRDIIDAEVKAMRIFVGVTASVSESQADESAGDDDEDLSGLDIESLKLTISPDDENEPMIPEFYLAESPKLENSTGESCTRFD